MYYELAAEVRASTNEELIAGLQAIIDRVKYGHDQGIFEDGGAQVNFNIETFE